MMNDNNLKIPCNAGEVSDGYHTFDELYAHRCALFVLLALGDKKNAFKTRLSHDGVGWAGWFILGIETTQGQITYHIPERYWNLVDVTVIEKNNYYDGHSSKDVLERLDNLMRDIVFE